MTLASLLTHLDTAGIALVADGERLRWTAPAGALTPDLRDALRDHKAALLACLKAGAPAPALPTPRPGSWSEIDLILPPDWPLAAQGEEGKAWRRLPDGRLVATYTPAGLELAITLSSHLANLAATPTEL